MSSEDIVGQVLDGKYSIEKQLGKGGMGTVYLSTHIGTGRPVAVKVIAPEFMKRSEFVERFRREAKAAGKLRHPNVVDVTDFGFSKFENGEDAAYLVMEYLDGCTLGEVLDEEKKLPVEFTINILEQVCSAVEEAHKQGIIHRDLKPDNIWLEPNQRGGYTVKVLDFGIAKLEETKLEEVAENIEIPYESSSKTEVSKNRNTVSDKSLNETVVDKKQSTLVSENETIAFVEESKTLVVESTESKTIIQPIQSQNADEIGSEDGTVILPSNQTQTIEPEDNRGTRIISAEENTEKSLANSSSTTNLTRVGAVLGTPLYMSPEQCQGKKLTTRSDIYSLAVISYQMLSGKLPFTGDYVKVMDGHKNEMPPELQSKKVPIKLKQIVMKSLSKSADERPVSAEAFASKLRANSEGLGVLLRRAIVIYSQRLPKFLSLTVLTFIPVIILTLAKSSFTFLRGFGVFDNTGATSAINAVFALTAFFVQIVTSAFLIGMTTWIVANTIAFPLKPISLSAAFREVKKRWKALSITVILSTLLSLFSWIFGFFVGLLGFLTSGLVFTLFVNQRVAGIFIIAISLVSALLIGITISSLLMLVSPSIMMEGVSGKAAFKRSIGLARRSFRTVFFTSSLLFFVPVILALTIGFALNSAIDNYEMKSKMLEMKREGVEPMTDEQIEKEVTNIHISGKGIRVNKIDDGKNSMSKGLISSLKEGISELIWTPLALLISSFTSVVIALIYFKTRQAGGESMQELLGKLDDKDQPQSKWQQRVRERLIQSGKVTGNTTNPSKSS